jgi:2-polyprenyl-3-methyl-5-hydroxy-6-metoxy-1,4-benzoquinol methylase
MTGDHERLRTAAPGPYPFQGRTEMLSFVPPAARTLLDVGCHLGGFGQTLRRDDPSRQLWAVEADPEHAARASPHYDHMVVGTYPDALAGITTKFDCVVFNDVLEHMVDPWAAVRDTMSYLSPRGVVVASIPNVRHVKIVTKLVLWGDWTYTDMGVLDRTHLRFFTQRTIRSLFADCGYVIERLEGINSIGHTRFRLWKAFPLLFGELAWTGFAVRARPQEGPR